MVLSNKKLKQKLRSSLAESLVTSIAGDAPKESTKVNTNLQVQSLKELLGSENQKPRLSKRAKRRKDLPLKKIVTPEGNNDETQKENKEISGSEDLNLNDKKKKKRKIKRKREEVEGQEKENGISEPAEKKPAKKKKKKKKRAKKQKKNKDDKVVVENNVEHKEELVKIDESQESVDIATKVYVGGIPYYSTEDDIRSFFESCGTITEVDCIYFPETGKFRGIAMINFKTEAAAKRALALDGADMGGLFLKIQPYKTTFRPQKSASSDFAPKIVEGYNRVYVGNLSWEITEDDLKNLFSDCKVSSVRFGMDKDTGEFRGYAHVDFEDSLSLANALKLDQTEVVGRPARITCAVPKKEAKTGSKPFGPRRKEKVEEIEEVEKVEEVQNDGSTTVSSSHGKKRRTCYECGVPGHISSDCPKKKQAVNEVEQVEEIEMVEEVEEVQKVENDISTTVSSSRGKKRRTCYECGVPGHISTDCPKKKQAVKEDETVEEVEKVEEIEEVQKVENDSSTTVSSSRGKKRRTCYECGVSGHISTDCPKKKQAVDPLNSS